ncbi:MAG: hypothetical protein ABL892_05580 [Thiobacillaceae bacterium]
MSRDDFSAPVKNTLAKRVAHTCSNPACRATTSGPHSDPIRSINVGVACHISAAAAGGPRFDSDLSADERASIENAVWLCQSCAKLIDSDTVRFPVQTLRQWKIAAEAEILRAINGAQSKEFFPQPAATVHTPIPKVAGHTYDGARERLIDAGWQPYLNHWSHAGETDMQYGNGRHFWGRGFHEIINASGTGLSHCTFGFVDVYRNKLIVVTAGEVNEEENWTAIVWNWYLQREDDT